MKCQFCQSDLAPDAISCNVCFAMLSIPEGDTDKPKRKSALEEQVSKKKTGTKASAKTSAKGSIKRNQESLENIPVNDSTKTVEEVLKEIEDARQSSHRIALGIDPGERHTGVSLRDDRGIVFLSSTYRRPDNLDEIEWSLYCADVARLLYATFEPDVIGIEKVVQSTGFSGGKRAPLNPRFIMMTAMAVGALAQEFRAEMDQDKAILVRPRKNGSQVGEDAYPVELSGRRPETLAGYRSPSVKVRDHEKSAYDVAATALFQTR